jgi:hypothetical protein
MSKSPRFDAVEGHEFKPKEKVFVIDPNDFDIWEAIIVSVKDGKYKVHYPDYPQDDQEFEDASRLLADTRTNRRIFNSQEAARQTQLPPLESDESEPASEESGSDDAGDYADRRAPRDTKSKKKPKKSKVPQKTRPKGSRVSPRRGG